MQLFGTSGIRGIVGEKLTLELCRSIGQAVGSLSEQIILGKDTRTSSDWVSNGLAAGSMSMGADIWDAGVIPTPTLAFICKKFKFDCGLMVTASHNPPAYNGIKFWDKKGIPWGRRRMQKTEQILEHKKFSLKPWRELGNLYWYENALEEYEKHILGHAKRSSAEVVLDCGGGTTSLLAPKLLRELGCSVTSIHSEPTGFFPRDLELTTSSLRRLKEKIITTRGTIGIAYDGDGDRLGVVDKNGEFIPPAKLICVFGREKRVVVPINTTMAVDKIAKEVIRTKIGDVEVAHRLRVEGADLGAEPSGTFIFPSHGYYPDGIFATCKLLEVLENQSLADVLKEVPEYPTKKGALWCKEEDKHEVMNKVKEALLSLDHEKNTQIDGIRIDFEHGWALVRASGTEPFIRITVETKDRESCERLYTKIEKVVTRAL